MNIWLGFIIGITSGLHCIGMCGPIAMAIPVNRENSITLTFGILQYNLGRILSYTLLGVIVGTIGLTAVTFGILQWLSIIAGLSIILFAWKKWLFHVNFGSQLYSQIAKNMGKVLALKGWYRLPLLGMLNGLLPCGMVYLALINAIVSGDSISSGLSMLSFGVGTLPVMFVVGWSAKKIQQNFRSKLVKIVPYILTIIGLSMVLRGMNLGIPYISPKLHVPKEEVKEKVEVEMECCHAPSKK